MKRATHAFLLLIVGVCGIAGCVPTLPWYRGETKETPHEHKTDCPAPAPVMPDQVTPANAHTMSQAMWDELDYAQRAGAGAENSRAEDAEREHKEKR